VSEEDGEDHPGPQNWPFPSPWFQLTCHRLGNKNVLTETGVVRERPFQLFTLLLQVATASAGAVQGNTSVDVADEVGGHGSPYWVKRGRGLLRSILTLASVSTFLSFFEVLGFELRAYHFSHTSNPFCQSLSNLPVSTVITCMPHHTWPQFLLSSRVQSPEHSYLRDDQPLGSLLMLQPYQSTPGMLEDIWTALSYKFLECP
jgi:hypothetical protein